MSADKILEKHPDRIPVIVKRGNKSTLENIKKNKFLVPKLFTLQQFVHVIRRNLDLDSSTALFFFINNTLPKMTDTMLEIYNNYKSEDKFLYITYTDENTFG